jgi:hypothetical protein
MSGECDKCGEHAMDCKCDNPFTVYEEIENLMIGMGLSQLEKVENILRHKMKIQRAFEGK